jgi:hypothetical protein
VHAVVGKEIDVAVKISHVLREGVTARIDVLDHGGPIVGPIAFPQLRSAPVVGGEEERAIGVDHSVAAVLV